MTTFKSKISYGILIPVLLLEGGIIFLPLLHGAPVQEIVILAALVLPVIALTLHIFLSTCYRITDNNKLHIKSGFIYSRVVDIASIKSIRPTRNPISSPAASLDRLELKFGKWDAVLVSPAEKAAFVKALVAINPAIEYYPEGTITDTSKPVKVTKPLH